MHTSGFGFAFIWSTSILGFLAPCDWWYPSLMTSISTILLAKTIFDATNVYKVILEKKEIPVLRGGGTSNIDIVQRILSNSE